ncbi:cytochrome P450 [Trichoderma chlorosporum]
MSLTAISLSDAGVGLATVFGLVLCFLTAYFHYRPTRAVKYFPGPTPWPLIGNLPYFLRVLKNLQVELPLMAERFGGLCMLWMGSQPTLVISSLKDADELLGKNGALTANRPKKNIFFQHAMPHYIGAAQIGDELRFFRRIYSDLLGLSQSQSVKKYQDYESTLVLNALLENPDAIESHLNRAAISVIFSAVYGVRASRLSHPILVEQFAIWKGILEKTQPGSLLIDYFPFLEKLPLRLQPWLKLADSLAARQYTVHMAFLKMLRKQTEAGLQPVCFGADMLQHQKELGFDDEMAIGILSGMILLGGESSSDMMYSFIKIMAMNPRVQKKAQEELDRVVGPSRLPTWEDQQNLPYIRAVIKELHRYSPVLTFAAAHASTEEITYKGCTIPNSTLILPSTDNLHHDAARYENADEFQPERFLDDELDAASSANHPDYLKRDHINYGFGRRLCQGIYVAENSLFIQASRYLWAFNITPRAGEPPLRIADINNTLNRRPKSFKVDIIPRSDAVLQVVRESTEKAHTDIPDVDDIDMAE